MKKKRYDIYRSDEELYFGYWLEEMADKNIISNIEYESESFELFPDYKTEKNKINKHIYTPDFVFNCNDSVLFEKIEKFYNKKNLFIKTGNKVYIEVKADFDYKNMTKSFVINQKWMFQKYGIYVNLVKIPSFFSKTFIPYKYLLTKKGNQRKINFDYKDINSYLDLNKGV